MPTIAAVNYSTKIPSSLVSSWVSALQTQVIRDLAPIWGISAVLDYATRSEIRPDDWVLGFWDNSDQAGALGDHDLTPSGMPLGKVFVVDSQNAGLPVSSVASHELLEMLVDPFIDSVVEVDDSPSGNTGVIYAQEVCDPCQADLYMIDGIAVSDFVTPAWFGSPGARFDFLRRLSAPFTLRPGGYMSTRSITATGLQPWSQKFADERARKIAKVFA